MNWKWKKLGVVFSPSGKKRHPKLNTHAANPLPIHISGDIYRIFYCARDAQNRSSIGAVDVDIVRMKIIQDYFQPFFLHGPKGSYYADGVSIGNWYSVKGVRYVLFMGWQRFPAQHWRGIIGRLFLYSDLTLNIENDEPFLALDHIDHSSLSYPWVLEKPTGGFEMFYGSTLDWDAGNQEMLHVINRATSDDGTTWKREGLAIPYEIGKAQAFSRPTVIINNDGSYDMWFSYRGGNGQMYRIGYGTSRNGMEWHLSLDEGGIALSESGWDSEMVEYPFVFDHQGQRYMLYNGNGYGKTGFGLAIWEPA